MSHAYNPYQSPAVDVSAARPRASRRAVFITKTYLHLLGGVGLFVLLESLFLRVSLLAELTDLLTARLVGLLVLLGLAIVAIAVTVVAAVLTESAFSLRLQYLGLGLYVYVEAVICAPLLAAARALDPRIIPLAAIVTMGLFGVLTLSVFVTRRDFSFLRAGLVFGSLALLGFLVICFILCFTAGVGLTYAAELIVTYAAIALACGWILHDTSEILHHYRSSQYVVAAVCLFASIASIFFWLLRVAILSRK